MENDQELNAPEAGTPDIAAVVANSEASMAGIVDRAGFDPAVHAVNPDGTPKIRGNGEFAKKRGRKPGQSAGSVAHAVQPGAGVIAPTPETRGTITNEEAARQTANALIGVGVAFIGPEWAPVDKSEARGLETAFKNYFDAKGQVNLPPEVGLALAVGAYGFSRFQHENTRTKFSKAFDKLLYGAKRGFHKIGVKLGVF